MKSECWNIILNIIIAIELGLIVIGICRISRHLKKQKNIDESSPPKKSNESNESKETKEESNESQKTEDKSKDKGGLQKLRDAFYKMLSQYFLLGVIIILLCVIFCCHVPVFSIEDNKIGVILAFVGILATFIVISNYAQVKEVKGDFVSRAARIEGLVTTETSKLRTEFQREIERIKKFPFCYSDEDMREPFFAKKMRMMIQRLIGFNLSDSQILEFISRCMHTPAGYFDKAIKEIKEKPKEGD
jgi:hypothetical protein